MEQEKLELLLKESKKRTFLTRIMACCMIIITVAMLVTVSVLVPKAIESMKHLNDAAVTFDNAVTEMHELTVELKDTNMLLQNFVNDNAKTLSEIITKINKIDFEALNEAIDGLRDTVEPFANFMNFFKK